jgi:general secretion pathway protein M
MKLPASWTQRSDAERRVIGIGAALVALAILATLWLQVERSRERLARELPALRASIAALERDAAEVKRVRSLPPAAPIAATPLASLATNGGGVSGAQITVLDERRVKLAGSDVAFQSLLDWLAGARASHGMRVESARHGALGTAGRVRAELVLTKS